MGTTKVTVRLVGFYHSPEGDLWERVEHDGGNTLYEAIERWAGSYDGYRTMLEAIGQAVMNGDSDNVPAKYDGTVWFKCETVGVDSRQAETVAARRMS